MAIGHDTPNTLILMRICNHESISSSDAYSMYMLYNIQYTCTRTLYNIDYALTISEFHD